jgi:hypothetical protein
LQDPPEFTQIGIFGLKTCHLATLDSAQVFFYLYLNFSLEPVKGRKIFVGKIEKKSDI